MIAYKTERIFPTFIRKLWGLPHVKQRFNMTIYMKIKNLRKFFSLWNSRRWLPVIHLGLRHGNFKVGGLDPNLTVEPERGDKYQDSKPQLSPNLREASSIKWKVNRVKWAPKLSTEALMCLSGNDNVAQLKRDYNITDNYFSAIFRPMTLCRFCWLKKCQKNYY